MNITRGPKKAAIRVGIYGTEGVGKTTFASRFPGAVFIDTEGSTVHMDVARFDPPENLKDVENAIDYVVQHPDGIGTLVIDTVDWLEKYIFRAVCEEKNLKSIEDVAYGKGYVFAKEKAQKLLEKLDGVIRKGINVVLVCHSMIKKFELPDEMGSYDRYMLKLNEKNIAPVIKEWLDMLLFVNYRTDIVKAADGKTNKGKGGQKRIMYANHTACWDAKNRFGLPDEMPFEYEQIARLFGEAEPVQEMHMSEPEPKKMELKPANAEVTTVDKVPEKAPEEEVKPTPEEMAAVKDMINGPTKKAKKGKAQEPPTERPDSMKSEDKSKDILLDKLWQLMKDSKVYDPGIIQAVVSEKDYYDLAVSVKDYDSDFIEGCLIEAWNQVNDLCQTKIHNLPF